MKIKRFNCSLLLFSKSKNTRTKGGKPMQLVLPLPAARRADQPLSILVGCECSGMTVSGDCLIPNNQTRLPLKSSAARRSVERLAGCS